MGFANEYIPITSPKGHPQDTSSGETKKGHLNPNSCMEGKEKLTLKWLPGEGKEWCHFVLQLE